MSNDPINIDQRTKAMRSTFRSWRLYFWRSQQRLSQYRNHRRGARVTSSKALRNVTADNQENVGESAGLFRVGVGSRDLRERMGISTRLVVVGDGL